MAKDRNGSMPEKDDIREEEVEEGRKRKAKSRERADTSDSESDDPKHRKHRRKKPLENSDSEEDRRRRKGDKEKGKSRKRRSRSRDSDSESENSEPDDDSDSGKSEYSESVSESESEEERRRRKKKEKRRREKEKEEREKRRRRKEKENKRRKKEKEEKRKKKLERGKKGAVTNSWGKYGIIRETDMWNKRPEFTAWLQEVKQVNLEHLPNWEEKQMFKQFMEDHNTATFSSKKYYNLDSYFKRKMEKEQTKGVKTVQTERVVFNDEEQRRLEMLQVREKQKEQEVEALKRSMQSGMAQAMKEQAQLREEMAYQYKLGNFEAAAAIQRRLDPDVAM